MKHSFHMLAAVLLMIGKTCFPQAVGSEAFDTVLRALLSDNVKKVSVREVASDTAGILFLDAREKAEYNVSHLRGARWVGHDDFDSTRVEHLDREQPVVVYCSVGYRSEKVAERLEKLGFRNVSNLYGGIFEWVNQGHEVVDFNDSTTQKVHAYNHLWSIWLNNGEKVYE